MCVDMQVAVELCWLTCVSSELNGEELTRSGGIDILGSLLARCCTIMPKDVPATQPAAIMTTHALRTCAGMAIFANAQKELASRCSLLTMCLASHNCTLWRDCVSHDSQYCKLALLSLSTFAMYLLSGLSVSGR